MTFYFSKILDEGTSNPIVARIGSQLRELLQLCRMDQKKKDDLNFIFHEMMKSILAADNHATPLIEELKSIEDDPAKHGLCLEKNKFSIPSSLKLDNIKVFLKYANENLKLLVQALAIFFEKGWTEAKFEPILDYVEKEQSRLDETWLLGTLLKSNLNWFADILELRNVDEHKFYKRQKKKALIENYTLSNINGHLTLVHPMLCNGMNAHLFLLDANRRLFVLSEEIIVSTIALFLPKPVSICEIPEKERREDYPKRFKHCLGFVS
ncbi:MAG: hypothetical protein ACH350_08910 [Parachlamydiaceae bacterium]